MRRLLIPLALAAAPAVAQPANYMEHSRYLWDIHLAGLAADCDLWTDPEEGGRVIEAITTLLRTLNREWGETTAIAAGMMNAAAMQDRWAERRRREAEGQADPRPLVCHRRDWEDIRARFRAYREGRNPHR